MTEEEDVTILLTLTRRTRAHPGEGRVLRVLPRGNRAGVDPGVSQDYLLRRARGGMTDPRAESGGDPSLVAERGGDPGLEAETDGDPDPGAGKEGGTTGRGRIPERGQEMTRIPRRRRGLLPLERRKTF